MKKIFKFSLLVLFAGIISCEDATDIIQESELQQDNAFQSLRDFQTGLNGVYAAYAPDAGSNGDGDILLFNELFTDNVKRGLNSAGQGNNEFNFILQPITTFPNNIWSNRYAVINFSNRVLRALDVYMVDMDSDDPEMADLEDIRGQLLAMRAFMHFELLQYFTEDYKNPSSPSVILVDFVPDIYQVFPRNTTGEVFAFVNRDLEIASELLEGFTTEQDYFYITQSTVKAMQARVAVTQGDYVAAETFATELLQEYPMSAIETYKGIFISDALDGTEVIWALSRRLGDNPVTDLYSFNGPGLAGTPFIEVSNSLYSIFDTNDVRKEVVIKEDDSQFFGPESTDNILIVGKYRGNTEDGPKINDIKIFRSSEMQLIKAETQARAGNMTAAAASIRAIRQIRGANAGAAATAYPTLRDALRDILLERRREFAFEGHRYVDLKRLGKEAEQGTQRLDSDCASFSATECNIGPNDYRFTLPIPRNETNANPTIQQNQGY